VVDERDFGSGSAWLAELKNYEDTLTRILFEDGNGAASSSADHAVGGEATRLRNLLQFEQNQDVDEDDLTQCNRKGERIMPTQRCAGAALKGEQCARKTRIGAYCYTHNARLLGLKIKKSLDPTAGRGLFTTIARKKDEEVCRYTGDRFATTPILISKEACT